MAAPYELTEFWRGLVILDLLFSFCLSEKKKENVTKEKNTLNKEGSLKYN